MFRTREHANLWRRRIVRPPLLSYQLLVFRVRRWGWGREEETLSKTQRRESESFIFSFFFFSFLPRRRLESASPGPLAQGSQLICRQDRVLINAETFSINIKGSLLTGRLLFSHGEKQAPIIRSTAAAAAAVITCICAFYDPTFCTWTCEND